jgi:DNA-binding NarL/FixJ family response regulator
MQFLVVDDHPLYIDALRKLLARAFRGVDIQAAATLGECLQGLSRLQPDLVLLDYSMPDMQGADSVRRVVQAAQGRPVLVMSGIATAVDVAGCITAGARGYLPKTVEGKLIPDAVSLVLHGGTYVPVEFMTAMAAPPVVAETPPAAAVEDFSPRELEMLRMIAAGASNKEIARNFDLQEVTVKFYMSRLFRRLGVKNRSQAAAVAIRCGVIPGV